MIPVEFRQLDQDQVVKFVANLREADRAELGAIDEADLYHYWASPERYGAYLGGEPMMMFGAWFRRGMILLWALGCPGLVRYKRDFLKWSRAILGTFVHKYRGIRPICVWVAEDYQEAQRWVTWMGFEKTKHSFARNGKRARLYELRNYALWDF